ncbi:MAG: sigma-70 family RNA polymerase sigma factor [Polyangiaceae bacterium]
MNDTSTSLSPSKQIPAHNEVRQGLAALRPDLYARALRLTRSPAQADDVVQETMLRALRFEGQYRAGTNLRAWVGQVLMSVFLTQCRRKKRERKALDNLHRDPCAWLKKDAKTQMKSLTKRPESALASLPEGYREAVRLVDIHDLSYREAAEKLDVPVGTIMSRLHRGRKLLAAQLVEPALAA